MTSHDRSATRVASLILLLAVALSVTGSTKGQPFSGPSYTSIYGENYSQTARPRMNPRTYTYNRYFYHNPDISPYLNLARPTSGYTNPYRAYVQPELNRRRDQQPASPFNPPPAASRSPYHNHWYGSGVVPR